MAGPFRTALFAVGFLTLGAMAGITDSAVAGPDERRSTPGPVKIVQLMGELQLTAEQEQALTTLIAQTRSERQADRSNRGGELQNFGTAMAAGSMVDRAALHAHIDARAEERAARNHAFMDGLLDIYESLDADQKAQLSAMMSERSSQRKQRRDARGPEHAPEERTRAR
jgi:Spy/CpxP family protein refolding chaperone